MKFGGWIMSWFFYYVGDFFSKVLDLFENTEWWVDIWYPLYNHCMTTSLWWQEKIHGEGARWPWEMPARL